MIVSDWGAKIIVPCVITWNPWECHYEAAGVQPFSLQLFCQHTKEWLQLMFVCGYTAPPAGVMYNNMFFFFLKILSFFDIHLKK